jgi:hypothetical protein
LTAWSFLMTAAHGAGYWLWAAALAVTGLVVLFK